MVHSLESVQEFEGVSSPMSFNVMQENNETVIEITYYRKAVVNCLMDFTWYPFDHQVMGIDLWSSGNGNRFVNNYVTLKEY